MSVTREVALVDIKRPPVFRVTVIQCLVLLVAAIGLVFVDKTTAWSAVSGGLVAVIPHLYFTFYAFRFMGARSSREIARSFYRGESGKFVLTLVGFAGVFIGFPQCDPLIVFTGFISMLALQWWLVAKAVQTRSR